MSGQHDFDLSIPCPRCHFPRAMAVFGTGRDALSPPLSPSLAPVPSPSQRDAIEAPVGPALVLAGPGAGKTFCLIERIRYLIERLGVDPERICAFTFTNKAAGEIAARLERTLGVRAAHVVSGTIHAFCADLLRDLGDHVGLVAGFGIADEEYQLGILRRIEGPRPWHRSVLTRFSAHRFRGDPLMHNDGPLFESYELALAKRNLLDFDMLVVRAAELLGMASVAAEVRARWDVVLVDEFQDLNPVQYRVIHELAREHRHLFAVGDDEQSIYSWAGADRAVFTSLMNDFRITEPIHLRENRRCPRQVFSLARRLVECNPRMFNDRALEAPDRESPFPVGVVGHESDDAEIGWLIDDLRRDRAEHGIRWGDVALLYRKHEIGQGVEAALINAGIPCRLAQGRALADDPVVAYVLAALRVIGRPRDDVHRDAFFAAALPRALFDDARAQAEATRQGIYRQLHRMASRVPKGDESGRKIRRALSDWRNLPALGRRHTTLSTLVQELLSRTVGSYRSPLEDRHDELSDPLAQPDVVRLAERLDAARKFQRPIALPSLGGAEIALKGLLLGLGFRRVHCDGATERGVERLSADATPAIGLPLGLFKAAQLVECGDLTSAFDDYTAIDLETTGSATETAEIVEIAAVRVRAGRITEEFNSLVRPRASIHPGASATHGIRAADVAAAPYFEDLWPMFRAFCGDDVIVAHNGYHFDFRILQRMVREQGKRFDLCTYDSLPSARDLLTTSCKLVDLAATYGVEPGRSHRALDDARTLARVFRKLEEAKVARARKVALVNLLGHLGVALALSDDGSLCAEARSFRDMARPFALGRYSGALEFYEAEHGGNETIPTVDEVIDRLGGPKLMMKIRAERTADDRYPAAMSRLRRLIDEIPAGSLSDQLATFLERAVLSRFDGHEPDGTRVNLLTLHSTKGLEFSRVYILGVEDAELPGGTPAREATAREIEEARRVLYVGMTRAKDRLVLSRVRTRNGQPTGGHRFLDEMGLAPKDLSPRETS
jgi:superfamily I DNA/RNA helicase/DNA polymerase III epsilon subunit-like protein